MARELINAQITHVSYVDKGANQKRFFLTKSTEEPTFQKEVKVFVNKEDAEQQLVYGVVYEPDTLDSHEDFMTADEIEKAAHGFLKDARNIDTQHDFESGVGEVVESYIAPIDMEIGEETITKGSWVLVTKASDEIWEAIQKGEYTGYSLAGTAETIEKEENEKPVSKSEHGDDEVKGFFNLLKSFFTGEKVEKGEVRDKYEKEKKRQDFWRANDALNSVIFNWDKYDGDMESDPVKIREALQDFVEIAQEVLIEEDIAKAVGKPPERNDEDMKKEDIEKMLDEKLSPITKKLEGIEKEEGGGEEKPTPEETLVKQFGEVLDEKLTPINERLETVEKARGISKQADPDNNPKDIEKSDNIWEGLL